MKLTFQKGFLIHSYCFKDHCTDPVICYFSETMSWPKLIFTSRGFKVNLYFTPSLLYNAALQSLNIKPKGHNQIVKGPPNTYFLENALKKTTEYFLKFSFYLKVQSFRLIMENNFIQMAALTDHAVAHTIQFLSTLSIVCSCILPMASRIVFFKASIVSGLSAYHLSNGIKSQLRGDQTTSALRLLMRSSKPGRKT